jgi:hypothetical protein
MSSKEDKKALMESLKSKVLSKEPETPVQTVKPVKEKVEEIRFTFDMPAETLLKVKVLAANQKTSIKKLILAALEKQYSI